MSWPTLCSCHISLLGSLLREGVIVTQSDHHLHPHPHRCRLSRLRTVLCSSVCTSKGRTQTRCKITPALGYYNLVLCQLLSRDLHSQDWQEFPFHKIGLSRRITQEQALPLSTLFLFFRVFSPNDLLHLVEGRKSSEQLRLVNQKNAFPGCTRHLHQQGEVETDNWLS